MLAKEQEVNTILNRLQAVYGIEIPSVDEPKYHNNMNGWGIPNTILTSEEALVINEAISVVPGVKSLINLIIPYRNNEFYSKATQDLPHGAYLGYEWPETLSDFNERFREGSYKKLPPSTKSACAIYLPFEHTMSDPFPNINVVNRNIKVLDPMSLATYGDYLRYVIVHELGHGLDNEILLAGSENMDDYIRKVNDRDFCTGFNLNIDHPLYESFARLAGWRLIKLIDLFAEDNNQKSVDYYLQHPEEGDRFIWAQKLSEWRKSHFAVNPRSHRIEETLSDYWAASILAPDLLNDAERPYFNRIHQGLKEDPKRFINQIAKKTMRLYY